MGLPSRKINQPKIKGRKFDHVLALSEFFLIIVGCSSARSRAEGALETLQGNCELGVRK